MPVSADSFTGVDLSRLPPPAAIETLDFETMRAQWLAAFQLEYPDFDATVESDPVIKLIELAAHREMIWRASRNAGLLAVMAAYATGPDLDHIAALFGIERFILVPADPENGVAQVLEPDDDFRRRMVLAPEGYSVAGPAGAYVFHALGADADVLDASAVSPDPGQVVVTVLSRTGDGTAPPALIDAVAGALNDESVRPLTDQVTVQGADIVDFAVTATLTFFAGPDKTVVLAAAQAALADYLTVSRRLGRVVTRAGIIAALMAEGVQNVALASPAADITVTSAQAGHCTGVTLIDGGTA